MEHQYSQLLVFLNSGIFIASSVLVNMYQEIGYKWIIVSAWWLAAISLILFCYLSYFLYNHIKKPLIFGKKR